MRANGSEDAAAPLYEWQVSAFDGLAGADQAIYNSLYTVKDEIPLIYDDINLFNEPGVKFRWPNLQDFEDSLLPPFYRDTSWEQNGSLQWSLYEPLAEGEMQGSTMYLGTDGTLPSQGSFLLDHRPRARRLHEQQRDRDLVEREEPRRDAARAAFAIKLILQGWREVVAVQRRPRGEAPVRRPGGRRGCATARKTSTACSKGYSENSDGAARTNARTRCCSWRSRRSARTRPRRRR